MEDIRIDCEVARRSLERSGYLCYVKGIGEGAGDDDDDDDRVEEGEEEKGVREAREWLSGF